MSDNVIWIAGAGNMAKEYAKVLREMKEEFITIGRGEKSAQNFEAELGSKVIRGGIKNYIEESTTKPRSVIVCVNDEELANTTLILLKYGIKNILVEKPGGLSYYEIESIVKASKEHDAQVFVAYNRRFYSSVLKALEIIKEDGGVKSFNFEFTEWSHIIETLDKPAAVLRNWLEANSSHVIDMAFFIGGAPRIMKTFKAGGLNWHPSSSIFSGAGISDNGALFSYQANWESPGRWGVEILTKNFRLIFKPLEKLQIQKKGSVAVEEYTLDDLLDKEFKPGIYKQVHSFLNKDYSNLCTIENQLLNFTYFDKIKNGESSN